MKTTTYLKEKPLCLATAIALILQCPSLTYGMDQERAFMHQQPRPQVHQESPHRVYHQQIPYNQQIFEQNVQGPLRPQVYQPYVGPYVQNYSSEEVNRRRESLPAIPLPSGAYVNPGQTIRLSQISLERPSNNQGQFTANGQLSFNRRQSEPNILGVNPTDFLQGTRSNNLGEPRHDMLKKTPEDTIDLWEKNRADAIKNSSDFLGLLQVMTYAKAESPFFDNWDENNPNKCHFYKDNQLSGRETYTRHHIIGADGYLREFWNYFVSYAYHSGTALNAFFDYIGHTRYYLGKGANAMDPLDKGDLESFRNMVIWNPGNLAIGPKPEFRAKRTQSNIFYPKDHSDLEDEVLIQLNKTNKDTQFIHGRLKKTIDLIRDIREKLNNKKEFTLPQQEDINKTFIRFWKNWTKVFNLGYIIYNWEKDKDHKYFPSNYMNNFSNIRTKK